jgi:hypothetical protein
MATTPGARAAPPLPTFISSGAANPALSDFSGFVPME